MRFQKRVVTYNMVSQKARELAKAMNIDNLSLTAGFVNRFCDRNHFVVRKPTHQAQETNKSVNDACKTVLEFLTEFQTLLANNQFDVVLNMDETPIYLDPAVTRTLESVGARTVDVVNTGCQKSRITLVVTISSDGQLLPGYLLFKGSN